MSLMVDAVQEGLQERRSEKESQEQAKTEGAAEIEKTEAAVDETIPVQAEQANNFDKAKE